MKLLLYNLHDGIYIVCTSKNRKVLKNNVGKSQEINQLTVLHCSGLQYPSISEQQEITSTYEDPR